MKQIVIGREGTQPFVIKDEYVSRQHAIFTYDESTGMMTLTDRSSSGTYIRMGNQYQQISQCAVNATTDVRLGPYFTFRIGQLFQQSIQKTGGGKVVKKEEPPKPEKVDISYLRRIAENYEEQKMKLDQKQANVNSLRSLSIVGTVAGTTVITALTEILGSEHRTIWYAIGFSITVIFLVSLLIYCSHANKEVLTKKNKNDKSYKITFCCPKCHFPLAGKLYENILAEGKCPKCKTEFHDSQM